MKIIMSDEDNIGVNIQTQYVREENTYIQFQRYSFGLIAPSF